MVLQVLIRMKFLEALILLISLSQATNNSWAMNSTALKLFQDAESVCDVFVAEPSFVTFCDKGTLAFNQLNDMYALRGEEIIEPEKVIAAKDFSTWFKTYRAIDRSEG